MEEGIMTMVIDNGSNLIKAGFGGEEYPCNAFAAITGIPRHTTVVNGRELKELYVADDAWSNRRNLKITRPIVRGVVEKWEEMEKIWHHTFYNELRIVPEEVPVLLTEPALNPKPNREQMTQIMFETFMIPALYVANQSTLALFANGRLTGVVLDSGETVTRVVPVYQGHVIPYAVVQLDLGGRDLTDYLIKLLEFYYKFESAADYEVARVVKEELCYVALDLEQELEISKNSDRLAKTYELPNSSIHVHSERFRCPEAMFQPSLIGVEAPGVHELIHDAIMKCDPEIQADLYNNIVLAGGNTMFPGMADRIQKELISLAPPTNNVRVIAARPTGKYATWVGGSMLANLSQFQAMWIPAQDYDEDGTKIVHRMCF
jgi:actin-related protein